jgi:hypothetical protein
LQLLNVGIVGSVDSVFLLGQSNLYLVLVAHQFSDGLGKSLLDLHGVIPEVVAFFFQLGYFSVERGDFLIFLLQLFSEV